MEHATIPKSRVVTRCRTQHAWVALDHLAPFAPVYTPLDRFWRWLTAKAYGARALDTLADVLSQVRQRIWHDQEGWLTLTSHLDFKDYQSILDRTYPRFSVYFA